MGLKSWRGRLSTLSGPVRARVMRKCGAVLVLDMEALTRATGELQKSVKKKEKSMRRVHSGKVAGIATGTHRVFPKSRQHRRSNDRDTRKRLRDCRTVARALEARVNPTEGGTQPRNTATLQSLQHWRDVHAQLLQDSMGTKSAHQGATAGQQQGNGSALGFC